MSLRKEFRRLKKGHSHALKKTAARIVLGASVMRVFTKGTRERLLPIVASINIAALTGCRNQGQFSAWFDRQVARVARVVRQCNKHNSRIHPGYKWGHTAKIVALFSRDLTLCSRYFRDADAQRISPFLHVPIDGVVIKQLRKLGFDPGFDKIKEIDSRKKFYRVQEELGQAAQAVGVPRVWFDDIWGERP